MSEAGLALLASLPLSRRGHAAVPSPRRFAIASHSKAAPIATTGSSEKEFNSAQSNGKPGKKKVSLADLTVLGGCAAVDEALAVHLSSGAGWKPLVLRVCVHRSGVLEMVGSLGPT